MKESSRTKSDLRAAMSILEQRNKELEQAKANHKRVEDGLRDSEEYAKCLFNSSHIPLIVMDPRTCIYTDCNAAAVRIYGYETREEVLGKTPLDVSAPVQYDGSDSASAAKNHIQACCENGSHIFAWRHRRPDGQIWDADVHLMLFRYRGNALIQFGLQDITERKQAEEKLQESRRCLACIIEFLPDATLVIDKKGTVVAWNRAMETMTGVRKEAMIGKGDYEYALPFYGSRRNILIDLVLQPDKEIQKYYTAIHRGGDILRGETFAPNLQAGNAHLSVTASVLRDSLGSAVAAIECIRDNTERKRLEERLNRVEKMEALGTLAGGVAHDLNNVLGIIVGFAELLLEGLEVKSPFRKGLLNILNGGQKASAIIQDLLALTRREITERQVLNLNKIIAENRNLPEFKKMSVNHTSIRITVDLAPDILNISGSSAHIGKALLNLVANACEAMPDGGVLTIKTVNRYLDKPIQGYDEVREGDYVVLSVTDTGQGIPADNLKRIFEPFYTKKVMGRNGTGLGLALVWGTVKDHNGYINVESAEGRGSVFSLYFPATRETLCRDASPVSINDYMGRGESILVVDDVEGQRELALTMLEKLNYTVKTVPSGEEAVTYLRNHRVDLMVLDMIMDPGMDGLETYRNVLAIHPRQKAIIVSGFSESDRVRAAQILGAGDHVKKPYIMEKLGLAVRKELNKTAATADLQ